MADILPVFPLSLVAFPGEHVNLHIFEPRYKQLIHECQHKGITFCILPYFYDKPFQYGTEMSLVEVVKTYNDGKMDIKTKAINKVRIINFMRNHPGKLYPGAEIEKIYYNDESDIQKSEKIVSKVKDLYSIMNISNVSISESGEYKTFQNIHKLGLSNRDELELLTMNSEKERQTYILEHLEQFIPMMYEAEALRKKAALNGHFKDLKPRL